MRNLLPALALISWLSSCWWDTQEYTEVNEKINPKKEVCIRVKEILSEESLKFKEYLRGEPGSFVAVGRSTNYTWINSWIGMAIGNESKRAWPVENWYNSEETIIKISNLLTQENIAGCRYQSGKISIILYGAIEKRTPSAFLAMELSSEKAFHTIETQENSR